MGAGSGGFYAAKQAFDQAAKDAKNPQVPADDLGPLIYIFSFVVMVAMLGIPGLVIGALLFGLALLGIANGTVMTLQHQHRRRMQVALVAVFLASLVPAYLGTRAALQALGVNEGATHVVGSAVGFIASFAGHRLLKGRLWSAFRRREGG